MEISKLPEKGFDNRRLFRLSIRTVIVTVLLVLVIVVAFAIAFLAFKNNTKSAELLISKSLYELNSKIKHQISSYLETPVSINEMNEKLITENLIDIRNQEELQKHFSINIHSHNTVNSIYFANAIGGLANAGIDKAQKRNYVIYTDKFQSGVFYKYATDNNGNKTSLILSVPNFDARKRPWYIKAQSQSGIVWSNVYIIATGNDLGITASKAVRTEDNGLLGVLGVDLFLSDLSIFLSNLDIGIGGKAFIIDNSGYLIASSQKDKLFNVDNKNQISSRIKATESQSDIIRLITVKFLEKYSDFTNISRDADFSVSHKGHSYKVQISPFNAVSSHQWLIITVIPEINFMAQVYINNRITIYLIVIAVLLSLLVAVLLARMISYPILKLDNKIREISQGEWETEPIPCRIKEIDDLSVEIYKMKTTIKSNIEDLNTEIAERKQAEAFLQNIIDENPISIQIVDANGYTIQVNPACIKLFGAPPPKDFSVFEDPQIQNQGQTDLLNQAKQGEIVHLPDMYYNIHDYEADYPDTPKWVKVVIFPIKGIDGKHDRFVLMHEDVTQRKETENALILAKESAEESSKIKSSFLANMSHELRTPLSGILGFSELLKKQLKDSVSIDMADMIYQSGNRLLNTLNLILDLSQLEGNKCKVEESTLNLNDIIQSSVNMNLPVAEKKGLKLTFTQDKPELFMLSDQHMLEQIVNELIGNAVKYTTHGSVSVGTGIQTTEKGAVIFIDVSDTGMGIPEEKQKIIFDAFRQVSEGWNRSFEGTGLGLTICNKYVEILGGELILESKFGQGSTFSVRFAVDKLQKSISEKKEIEAEKEKADIDVSVKTKLPKILLVDDDDTCYAIVSRMLKNHAVIDFVTTGEESLLKMEQTIYAAVLLDINLKIGMSGLDVIAEIEKMEKYHEVPVIAITAYAMLEDKELFLSHGFSDYLSKPFTINELINMLHKWIK